MTQYTYNGSSDKLTKVEQKSGGVVKAAVEYGYTKDQLTRITHNGFDYTLTYDKFGNPLTTKVAGQALSTNIYGPRNGFLERMNYGNGAYIEYQYDPLYRVNAMWLNGFKRNGVTYTYVYNGLGDVMEILDKDGNAVVSYLYDAWGAPISITGPMASTLGVQNPIRYRGYYYDTETGLYYLQSRYYDPVVGRFLNADGLLGANGDLMSYNLFAYCSNNPVNMSDPTGEASSADARHAARRRARERKRNEGRPEALDSNSNIPPQTLSYSRDFGLSPDSCFVYVDSKVYTETIDSGQAKDMQQQIQRQDLVMNAIESLSLTILGFVISGPAGIAFGIGTQILGFADSWMDNVYAANGTYYTVVALYQGEDSYAVLKKTYSDMDSSLNSGWIYYGSKERPNLDDYSGVRALSSVH